MFDLINIALDYLTDNQLFEKLASEIMRDEGYPNIKPLGGLKDMGQDAVQDRFYLHEGRSRIVFQYTLQEYLCGKIEKTVRDLSKNGISYHELVIVTHRSISAERQRSLIETARKKHDVSLKIFEKRTIANRLANRENGIFVRYFSNIEKQIATLTANQVPMLSGDGMNLVEISMLKSSIAFTFNKDAPRARKSIFDFLTLGLLLEKPSEYIAVPKLDERYGIPSRKGRPPEGQVRSSLNRLTERGFIEWKGDAVRPSSRALEAVDGSTAGANDATRSLITDIVDEVCQTSQEKISEEDRLKIERNTQEVFVMLFRLSGIEIANQVLKERMPGPVYLDSMPALVAKAKRQLPANLGELLISVISQKLATPSKEQARTLTDWSLAYIGAEDMNLDPNLKEFQATRFARKTFVLDTDFILDCLVKECLRSKIYLNLVNTCLRIGSKVIIPISCLSECIKHAQLSPRTYNHFGSKLLSYSEEIVYAMVWNVFVKGYYSGILSRAIPRTMKFENYLQNYYNQDRPIDFMREVIKTNFPPGVEILDPSTLLSQETPEELIARLREELFQGMMQSKKAGYRTLEGSKDLADTDARLFLTTLYLNGTEPNPSGNILGGDYYLVTGSGRYLRAVGRIGLKDVVTTRPQSLIALLDLIGNIELTGPEFVNLFENPLLAHAAELSWGDVSVLVDSGIQLNGMSLPRLRYDLDEELHRHIVAFCKAETKADRAKESAEIDTSESAYIKLLKSASARGYKKIPEVERFMQILERTKEDAESKAKALESLAKDYQEMEKTITYFGKKKQRYLQRMASRHAIRRSK
jgi:hypothetical protein